MKLQEKVSFLLLFFLVLFLGANFCFPEIFRFNPFPKKEFKLGLDLQGGIELLYQANLSQIPEKEKKEAMEALKNVIEKRVNFFGVREPVVQIQGERIIIELSGFSDPQKAIEEIGKTPFLEFREKKNEDFVPTPLTGRYLKRAQVGFDQVGNPIVLLEFNDEGAKIFAELTEKNVGKPLAIFLDGKLISAPTVKEKIPSGKAEITGKFTLQEAKELVRNLNAGALPVPIELVSYQIVGPTLGKASLEKILKAGLVGFLLIAVFMIIIYKLSGLVAILCLVFFAILNLTLYKLIPVTLTLSGIAGFLLSLGMTVDANILIFSRAREELKTGKSLSQAFEEGFKRAWPAIRDGNLTTLVVNLILLFFGTSFVRGFATTLSLGILISMFTAIVMTREFLKMIIFPKIQKVII
jgi:protein-export SecD/SecF family membrane protein